MRFLLILLLLLSAAQAHTPLITEAGDSLDSAVLINDPTKSWAFYAQISPVEVQYYRFNVTEDDRIYLSLLASPANPDLAPSVWLLGPELAGEVPSGLEAPAGSGALAVPNQSAEIVYEPFGPGVYYRCGDLDISAPANGTYYVAVRSSQGGAYSLVVGYQEKTSLNEWLILPLRMTSIYRWEGQSLPMILAPMIAVILLGFLLLRTRMLPIQRRLAVAAGLLFLASGASFLYQIYFAASRARPGDEILISLTLAVLPLIVGAATLRIALGRGVFNVREKLALRLLGVLGLLALAGMLLGPLLAIVSTSVAEPRTRSDKKSLQQGKKGKRK